MRAAFARRYDTIISRMEEAWLHEARASLLAGVGGTVVEIGAGTGRNLDHYPATVERLVLTEPTAAMRDQLRSRLARTTLDFEVEVVDATADELPLPDSSADAIVSTLVLCSVPDLRRATVELARVLRPGGQVHLIEHTAAPGGIEARAQAVLDPVWSWLEGSCHLDHRPHHALAAAGFDVDALAQRRQRGQPPLFRDILSGTASRR